MKVKRMLGIDKRLYDRLNKVCEEEGFYRNSFITHIIQEEIDTMNSFDTIEGRIRLKERKARFQINIEEDLYNSIKGNKTQRIEKILDEVLRGYENGTKKY